MRHSSWWLIAVGLSGVACGHRLPAPPACLPSGGITPVCGLQNPEDLAMVPGGTWLIASQYRREGDPPGGLVAVPASGGAPVRVYPPPPDAVVGLAGVPGCAEPPDPKTFAPHGVDLIADGPPPWVMLVVNHGGREAVEVFGVMPTAASPAVTWHGCVKLPPGIAGNDVAGLPEGGFAVTQNGLPKSRLGLAWSAIGLAFGKTTGNAIEWHRDGGWRTVPGTGVAVADGIAAWPDGKWLFVNAWAADELVRIERHGDPARRTVALPMHPDNLTWAPDGRLLVAGQKGSLREILKCADAAHGNCTAPFAVVAVDPESLATTVLFEHDGSGLGGASVALRVGDALVLGTFSGDRLGFVRPAP